MPSSSHNSKDIKAYLSRVACNDQILSGFDWDPAEADRAGQGGAVPVQHDQARGGAGGPRRQEPHHRPHTHEVPARVSPGRGLQIICCNIHSLTMKIG